MSYDVIPSAPRPPKLRIFLAIVLGGVLAAGFVREQEPPRTSNGALVERVLAKIQRSYVDPMTAEDINNVFQEGLDDMVKRLDRNTRYVPPRDVLQFEGETEGSYIGIGVVISPPDPDYPTITTVIHGGPAAEAGLEEGDQIVAIDDEPTLGVALNDVTKQIKGLPGTTTLLSIAREGDEIQGYTVARGRVAMASVAAVRLYDAPSPPTAKPEDPGQPADSTDTPVGYIRLVQFQDGSTEEIEQATRNLVRAGASAIVLDLRYNGGGILDQAVEIVRLFLAEGHILTTRGRNDWDHPRTYRVHNRGPFADLPIVLLMDGGTASSSEIVSAALRDHHRALLVGGESYGKWTVQTIYPLGEKSIDGILKLTTRRHYPPKGLGIHEDDDTHQRRGLLPDIKVSLAEDDFALLFQQWRREQISRVNTPLRVDVLAFPDEDNQQTLPSLDKVPPREDAEVANRLVVDEPLLQALQILRQPVLFWEQIAAQRQRWHSNSESDEVNVSVAKENLPLSTSDGNQ